MTTKGDVTASQDSRSSQVKRRLIVLTGPTAAGKGTVEGILREKHPHIWLSVSATTRDPRPGEFNGIHYWFLDEEELSLIHI